MDESGHALEAAVRQSPGPEASVASQILSDPHKLRTWEASHARLLLPVAERRRREEQLVALRVIDTQLLQQSSLFNFLRDTGTKGRKRARLFSVFYGPKDPVDAILCEHRRYLLAGSSHLSVDHLLHLMHDGVGDRLLQMYKRAYSTYFALYCYFRCNEGNPMGEAVGTTMSDARKRVRRIRQRLMSELSDNGHLTVGDELLLAESGRYEALNYLNR
ncbi:MAG: hypothetical protein R3288_02050 [Woeseiaceae bacterium]|nr:hypothetical protein [Woeseiaceae bacterium]